MMSNELTIPEATSASLVDIRMDKQSFPRIHTIPMEDAVQQMTRIVAQAFMYRGQQVDPTNIQFISCSLVEELKQDNEKIGTRFLTFTEIARIIKRSVLASDVYLSVSSMYRLLADYVKGEGHRAELEAKQRQIKATREAIENSPINTMIQAYAESITNR